MKVSIVITDFNGWDKTESCLRHIQSSQFETKVIVVDHGTTDDTRTGMLSYPEVIRIQGSSSDWWSGATNLGVAEALDSGSDYIVLLNNDCYVREDTISTLISSIPLLAEPELAVVAPVQNDLQTGENTNYNLTTCIALGFLTLQKNLVSRRKTPVNQTLLSVGMIIGGRCVLIPAEVFRKVGVLDAQRLPHYAADHDFFLRCLESNIELFVHTKAYVDVGENTTTYSKNKSHSSFSEFIGGFTSLRSHRNIATLSAFFRKHYPIKGLYLIGVALFVFRYSASYLFQRAFGKRS